MGVADAVSEQLWSAFNNVSASHYSEVQTVSGTSPSTDSHLHSMSCTIMRSLADHCMYCTQILTNHGAEQVNGSDIAQQVADDISDTLETLKSTLQVSGWGGASSSQPVLAGLVPIHRRLLGELRVSIPCTRTGTAVPLPAGMVVAMMPVSVPCCATLPASSTLAVDASLE